MSNALAIAAVTATMSRLLADQAREELAGGSVTVRPLDRARGSEGQNQLNLFLYSVTPNAAWRNMDMPSTSRPGELGFPPLALTLHYLLTAYGRNDDQPDPNSHRILGAAMRALHDAPVLRSADIKAALSGNNLYDQIEQVRITPQPLSLEEMSKLWAAFQEKYRLSVAYEVSVVLIESEREARAALPVLRRGAQDQGITSQADVLSPFPTLIELAPPQERPAALLGDTVALEGFRLAGATKVRISSRRRPTIDLPVAAGASGERVSFQIPNQAADWPAGTYTAAVVVQRAGEPERITNELPFAIAPRISGQLPATRKRDDKRRVTIDLPLSPDVLPDQNVLLLIGDRAVPAQPHTNRVSQVRFVIEEAPVGEFFVRVRVDGVDTLLVKDYRARPPAFDATQKVTITT